jgi:hypothetical protein
MNELPAISLAKRLVAKHGLVPPVDVDSIVRRYAHLHFADFPVEGIDGICVDLKALGKLPRVIVNSRNPPTRQRFTLAHELGHIVIPWHMGTIIDRTEADSPAANDYWEMEAEANAFAAELLMPSEWIASRVRDSEGLAQVHATVFKQCKTSPMSAAIQLARQLPANTVFAAKRNGLVEFSGRTSGTLASELSRGSPFDDGAYAYCEEHSYVCAGEREFHWWRLPSEVRLESDDPRTWRDILDQIVLEIRVPSKDVAKFKMSINGVIASANSSVKRSGNHTVATVCAASLQRLRDREQFAEFSRHPKFAAFVLKRAQDLVSRGTDEIVDG